MVPVKNNVGKNADEKVFPRYIMIFRLWGKSSHISILKKTKIDGLEIFRFIEQSEEDKLM
jgi:hypothetical protein